MEYRIAICDDEEAQREYLVSLVRSWSAEAGVTAKVTAFSSGESLLFGKDGQEIFLLDIEMPGIDGIALAQELRKTAPHAPIVFITGYDRYLAKGYDVAALHYLLKPLDKDKFFAVLNRAAEQLGQNENASPWSLAARRCASLCVRSPGWRCKATTLPSTEKKTTAQK